MGGKTALVWDEQFVNYDFGPQHPLRPIRVKMTYELLKSKKILDDDMVRLLPARTAKRQEILLFHEESYVRLVEEYSRRGSGFLDQGDTPAFRGCYEAASLVAGASLVAAENVMRSSVSHAFNPSGGLHHAHPERASGFCIFNDPAIVIGYLKSEFSVKRLVYLDIDAHHGDGVMYGYYDDPGVLDVDFHESGRFLFPGTGFPDETGVGPGKGFKVNLPLPPSTGDEAFLSAFKQLVPGLLRDYRPEMILVQCGADGHESDRLAHLRLTTKTYSEVIKEMHNLAHELCNGRFLLYGGGGYTVTNVPRVWAIAFASLAGIQLTDEIPEEWQRMFASTVQEDPPGRLFDKPTGDSQETQRIVLQTLTELRSELKTHVSH
jgi:acetoin utilization protein AcuC